MVPAVVSAVAPMVIACITKLLRSALPRASEYPGGAGSPVAPRGHSPSKAVARGASPNPTPVHRGRPGAAGAFRQALVLDILKALFVFLVSGFTAGFLSLCGGLLSLAVMWVLYYLLPVRPTWFILSVCGALAHNVGQLLGAGVIISSSLSLYYAPVMLVLGLVMGALTSVTLQALLPALGKMGFNTHENRPE